MSFSMRLPCQKGLEAPRSTPSIPSTTWEDLENFWISRTHNALWFGLLHSQSEAQFWIGHIQLKQSRRGNRPHLRPHPHFNLKSSGVQVTVSPWKPVRTGCTGDVIHSLSELLNLSGSPSPHHKTVIELYTLWVGVWSKGNIYKALSTQWMPAPPALTCSPTLPFGIIPRGLDVLKTQPLSSRTARIWKKKSSNLQNTFFFFGGISYTWQSLNKCHLIAKP